MFLEAFMSVYFRSEIFNFKNVRVMDLKGNLFMWDEENVENLARLIKFWENTINQTDIYLNKNRRKNSARQEKIIRRKKFFNFLFFGFCVQNKMQSNLKTHKFLMAYCECSSTCLHESYNLKDFLVLLSSILQVEHKI